ncbi:cob(I)yrinic acid a,c-diamide adenosyltransferase [Aquibium carbonis]|uniref:Corrinoid adenosyltransferase n=1 Tax=Aquibium carbonis TaxID=2495581 RepID=A0A429YXE3_9HYPH|nr:cob(I)yrinic acid a,c-diamide adenosyltransferase [Aquibium carbonis]RST86145.1 cob(I)yrinic acid a,c-diamide adenosyltransferase [Aquibium carbonis]
MVKLNKIYTRTGDGGTTGLVNGERRAKSDLRIEAFGTVDEANACIGLARLYTATDHPAIDEMLERIQNDLFDLGADLATPGGTQIEGYEPLRIVESQVARIEADIDALNARLEPLRSFVLPGGTPAAAALHLARTVARRAERAMVAANEAEAQDIGSEAMKYINRVSDFLFVSARAVNGMGSGDVLWVPGANR